MPYENNVATQELSAQQFGYNPYGYGYGYGYGYNPYAYGYSPYGYGGYGGFGVGGFLFPFLLGALLF